MTANRMLLRAGAAALALVAGQAAGKTAPPQGYVVDAAGNVVSSGSRNCIRTGAWTKALAIPECDPSLIGGGLSVPPPVQEAAPPLVQEAPRTRVSFAVEALFDFDQSVLRQEGMLLLDRLAESLGSTDYDVIVATGHADRLGREEYNLDLSARRSEAVKEYLVSKGVPPNRIRALAVGELQPLTRPEDCSGDRAYLIECLQPDRRVDVETTGYKSQTSQSR
jgi:OmpA-OmpF porin, OOP family